MSEPRKIRVSPQDIGYPEITVPPALIGPLERAEREKTAEDWDALHLAVISHTFPRPAFTDAWEADYAAVAWLQKYSVAMLRAVYLAKMLAPEPQPAPAPARSSSFDLSEEF